MVEGIAMMSSSVQLQALPNFDFADPFIFTTSLIAALLAFMVSFFFYRFYRISGFVYLLGIVIAFSFMTFAEILLAVDVWQEFNPELFNLLFWLRLISLSYGFSFLAVSYYYKHREEDKTPMMMRIAGLSAFPFMVMIAAVVLLPPTGDLPPYNQVDEYFRVFNLVMLGYVLHSTLNSILRRGSGSIYIPAAYFVLWIWQFSGFVFGLDGNSSSFITQHVAKVVGLALFAGWWYQIIKGKKVSKTETEA